MCGILAFLPVSCSDDSPVTGSPLLPEAPEGKVNVFLSLHKGSDYESPATRSGTAADETIMGPPWVLVFLGNDKDATFLEAVQANMTSAGELYAQLSACNSSVVLLLISKASAPCTGTLITDTPVKIKPSEACAPEASTYNLDTIRFRRRGVPTVPTVVPVIICGNG